MSFRMIGKLSDVSHPQIDIRREEAGIRSAEKLERGMQTEEMKRKEQGNDPIIDLVISSHAECEKHWHAMSKLDKFHERTGIQLQQTHTFQLPLSLCDASVVSICSASSSRRCAILFGETIHDEWCSHQGLTLIINRNNSTQHPLPVCPSSAIWSSSLLFVGDAVGSIHVYSNDKHMLSHDEIKLNNSNLSRSICRQTTVNKAVCIAALNREKNEVCMGSETGGMWLLTLPDLELRTLNFPPQAVEFAGLNASICHRK
ncbi:hypothetical protein WR25_22829 [Diploscapter pachys]|uniref:Uncharacterized protein n=1 Tax=Diploscapter pachys TaxID=2018661 RepID=A0A2A2KWT3_9BILA|nr:hypothetical protein WR25_22829 [Diploscapter pachys]